MDFEIFHDRLGPGLRNDDYCYQSNSLKISAGPEIWWDDAGWETSARPLANASENFAEWEKNRPGRVEFGIGYIRDYPVCASASAKKF